MQRAIPATFATRIYVTAPNLNAAAQLREKHQLRLVWRKHQVQTEVDADLGCKS